MRADEFYKSRKNDWQSLSALLDKCQQDMTRLTPEEVDMLGALYRAATSDLALAQRDFPSNQVTEYLNQLVARAHAVIYRGEPLSLQKLKHFFTTDFPRQFRQSLPFIIAAAMLFIIPALAVGISTYLKPDSARWLLPAEVQDLIPQIKEKQLWVNIPVEERPYASSFIMQNNIRVSFLAFASGITAGLLTLWVMVMNGLILGGLTGLTGHYGVGFELWNFVIGHGVIELSVIFIAGGSGLMIGWSLLRPGLLRRQDALVLAARKSLVLLMGAVPMLVIAGTIEGFISPNDNIPWFVKWGIGIGTGIIFYSYLFLAGREKKKSYKVS